MSHATIYLGCKYRVPAKTCAWTVPKACKHASLLHVGSHVTVFFSDDSKIFQGSWVLGDGIVNYPNSSISALKDWCNGAILDDGCSWGLCKATNTIKYATYDQTPKIHKKNTAWTTIWLNYNLQCGFPLLQVSVWNRLCIHRYIYHKPCWNHYSLTNKTNFLSGIEVISDVNHSTGIFCG